MLTYDKKTQKPRLEIMHDEDAMSPRDWDNLGILVTRTFLDNGEEAVILSEIVENTSLKADSLKEHLELMEKETEGKYKIYPVGKCEYLGVKFYVTDSEPRAFGHSIGGFYFVPKEKSTTQDKDIIRKELEFFTKWVTGEVYTFTLYDEKGRVVNRAYGIYDLEEIREYLPDEFENEDLKDYLIID